MIPLKRMIEDSITHSRPYREVINTLKAIKLPKRRVSLYSVLTIFFKKIRRDELLERSYSVAFNFFLAIFPLIIFLFTLIPYIGNYIEGFDTDAIMEFLRGVMPPSTYEVLANTIKDIISRQRGELLSFGFLSSIFLATNGVLSLMTNFNRIHKTVESRGFIKSRMIATLITFMLAGVFFIAIILLIAGQFGLHYLVDINLMNSQFELNLLIVLRFVVILLIFQVAISLIYYFGPAVHDKLHFFSPGSILAALFSVGVSFLFSQYITNFGTYNKFYGSIGAIMALMLWQAMLSFILLLGYELNASIDKASRGDFD